MSQLSLIIIGILVAAVVILLLTQKGRKAAVGICTTALDQTVRKSANTEKALAFIKERGQATNEELRAHLGVSRQSVARYMDKLEAQGAVRQVGTAGRSVSYRLA